MVYKLWELTSVRSVELPPRRGLLGADAAGGDVGLEVVLAAHGRAGQPAEHGELADVREGVGDRPLEELLRREPQRRLRGQERVDAGEAVEEPRGPLLPGHGRHLAPDVLAFQQVVHPVEEVPEVRQDLAGRAAGLADAERGEARGRAAQDLASSVGQRRQGVAQEVAFVVIGDTHGFVPPSRSSSRAFTPGHSSARIEYITVSRTVPLERIW